MPETTEVALDATAAAWLEAARLATRQITELTEVRDRAIEQIKATLGDACNGTVNGRLAVTWRPSRPSAYIDKTALERDHPDIAAQYIRMKAPARPFRLIDPAEASQ